MEDYKPNSHKYKELQTAENEERVKLEPIVQGRAKKKNKLVNTFISEDAGNIKQYILMDVLVPSIKKALSDIVTDGISMLLYGDTSHGRSERKGNSSYVSYNRFSDRRDGRSRPDRPEEGRVRYSCDDIILNSRSEAEEVLDRLDEIIDSYGMASVADLYDLVGITRNYTDNYYGWMSIRNAEIERVRDGYMLRMPKVVSIK